MKTDEDKQLEQDIHDTLSIIHSLPPRPPPRDQFGPRNRGHHFLENTKDKDKAIKDTEKKINVFKTYLVRDAENGGDTGVIEYIPPDSARNPSALVVVPSTLLR